MYVNAARIAAEIKLWLAEADGDVVCDEALTAARCRSALDSLYYEQQTYGACTHAVCSMPSPLQIAERSSPPILRASQAPSTGLSAKSPRSGLFSGAIGRRLRWNPPAPLCGSAGS